MRIVIDMQGAQTESRFRGIGRYALEFAQAVARNRGEHQVLLALSGLFPDTIEPIRAAFEGLLPQENIRAWHAIGPVKDVDPSNQARREVAELMREAFLASLKPDVIHVTSLFEGYVDDAVTSIGKFDQQTPVSISFFDLIPLLNPDQYLKPNPDYASYYARKMHWLNNAKYLFAISGYTRQEGLDCLGIGPERIVNVSTAIGPEFQPKLIDQQVANGLRAKLSLHRPFVLYTGGADDRKNLPRLIEAWSALPTPLRQAHQLVLAGRMSEGQVAELRRTAIHCGLSDDEMVFSGYVSDEELVQLYNLCALYVFPSWHEGFGLPALEAMACGAPVIGANTTSLPEVIGLTEALFDPMDVLSISAKIQDVLETDALKTRLQQHGVERSKLFSWDTTASRAIAAWETLPQEMSPDRVRSWHDTYHHLESVHKRLINDISAIQDFHPNKQELRAIAIDLAKNERQTEIFHRNHELPQNITWRIEGPFDSNYSLALVNREMALAMKSLGHKVVLHSTEGPGDFPANEEFLAENRNLAEMHQYAFQISAWDADVTSRNIYPPRVKDMVSRLNLLHAYGWEESGFPLDWIDQFNQSLQGMTVTSRHVAKIMLDHGFTKPLAICSNGVDHWEHVQSDQGFELKAKGFRFLHVSSCFPRKGADVMLRAYGRAFRDKDDVSLIIKTFSNPHNEVHRWLEDARAGDPHYPDVQIIEGDFSDAQIKALYESCHALVAPSRAEGFGLPMAEAMLSGLAVITTGWSGQTDFCTEDTAWLIDYSFERANTHFGLFSSVWAEPNQDHLQQLMQVVYHTPKSTRRARIEKGQKLLLENFRWTHAAHRTIEAARRWSVESRCTEPHIGWITSWNTKCGIANYSEHLIRNMSSEVTVLAAKTSEPTRIDGGNVKRSWSIGDQDDLSELARVIKENSISTLMIQFNYGFFNFDFLADFLNSQVREKRIVIVTLHSTTDPTHAPHKKLQTIARALKACNRVFVHSVKDLNRLKQLDIVDNVTLFPHGILDYEPDYQVITTAAPRNEFNIASYGFFLPHKGLLELIESAAILKKRGINLKLNMINAEYPTPESAALINQAKLTANKHKLNEVVNFQTNYLSDEESLHKLSQADLIVFPYQATGESSSAAVRHGIAVGRPVAVTPLAIFDDVLEAVHKLPGTSALEIADGISTLINDINANKENTTKVANTAAKWRKEHQYSRIGQRINNILIGLSNNRPN